MEASRAEKNTYGEDVKLHPITLLPLEQGSGALPHDQQALLHLRTIEAERGEEFADTLRKKMGIPTRADHEAAAKEAAEQEAAKVIEVSSLHERISELEAEVAKLTKSKE